MSERLDLALVARGLAESRSRAQALIADGAVSVNGAAVRKASARVAAEAEISVEAGPQWVSRAALKLLHALDVFGVEVPPTCLDLGASTGGFTEVLLSRGAVQVFAVDVGHGQLAAKLATDPRVVSMEGTHAKDLTDLPPIDLIVADLSFISLTKALTVPLGFASDAARLIALIKPQFEVGREGVGKGGIVRDPALQEAACEAVTDWLCSVGWSVTGRTESPITGGDGNVEFLVQAVRA